MRQTHQNCLQTGLTVRIFMISFARRILGDKKSQTIDRTPPDELADDPALFQASLPTQLARPGFWAKAKS